MITFESNVTFNKLSNFLKTKNKFDISFLKQCGEIGVDRLKDATPRDTGTTANGWYYEIKQDKDSVKLSFCNSNIQNGVPIAIILQYGHSTRNGGWVSGIDYINPVLKPIFDDINKMVQKGGSKY